MHLSLNWLLKYVDLPEKTSTDDLIEKLTLAGLEVEACQNSAEFFESTMAKKTDSVEESVLEKLKQDTTLEISVTPNRPDALSYLGVARELSALYSKRPKVVLPSCKEMGLPIHEQVDVDIMDKSACPRYACRVIENIKVDKSPNWLAEKLLASGIRPINNVVDVTNYILLERGHPLHAFDAEKLKTNGSKIKIQVRRALPKEKLTTLDGQKRTLTSEDVVISDGSGPVALAGVMGGAGSEVQDSTTSIVLECAYFEPAMVRRMAKRHGLHTESSYRFERGCDPNGVKYALDAAAQLVSDLAGGRISRDLLDVYPNKVKPVEVPFRMKNFLMLSGYQTSEISDDLIRNVFLSLGIEATGKRGDAIYFSVPTYRPDLLREIDLFEEAIRLIGLDKVPLRLAYKKKAHHNLLEHKQHHMGKRVRDNLISSGFYEAINYSFGSEEQFKQFDSSRNYIKLTNPLGEEFSTLRRSLLPQLMANANSNFKNGRETVQLFEMGPVFLGKRIDGQKPTQKDFLHSNRADAWANEQIRISAIWLGNTKPRCFDAKTRSVDYYDMKGVLSSLFSALNISDDDIEFRLTPKAVAYLHPGEGAQIRIQRPGSKTWLDIGVIGKLHPQISEGCEFSDAYCFELNFDNLLDAAPDEHRYKPFVRLPGVVRDLAFVVKDSVSASDITSCVKKNKKSKNLLQQVEIFDVYRGKGIEAGEKSIAIALSFQGSGKTLKDAEVNVCIESIQESLKKELKAKLR